MRLPANLKEEWRKEFDAIRQTHETANLGQYEQLYPCYDKPAKMEEYKVLLNASRQIFAKEELAKYGNKSSKRVTANVV